MDTVIGIEHVSKKYCRSLKHTMLYGVQDIARNAAGLTSNPERLRKGEFWALDDVSFEVKRGETLGIIGANGSGKTTLLKLINGILLPDKGKIEIQGRVGALIEVGAGFHPLLTGRENIYVNGAILGMSRREIDEKFDEIEDFADIGEFLDVPVKHYSSGMYVRLGFAVAVHSEPDILLIDEVLAVGDEQFQRRCINKISKMQEDGKTIMLVSHALTTVEGICSKVIELDKGKVKTNGIPERVIDEYLSRLDRDLQKSEKSAGRRWGTGEAEILDFGLFNGSRERTDRVTSGDETIFIMRVKFNTQVKNPIFGILIKSEGGIVVYGTNSRWRHMHFDTFEVGEEVKVIFKQKMQLTAGVYHVDPAIAYSDGITFYDWQERALEFIVELPVQTTGFANLDSQISITRNA
ncbi:MAG: ABC transporter ATP-binding protein [Nitrospirae bacterium]|nr:ABC transporter ATP-binding protein [Nitrospirota bacterium]MCL5236815.1 ABC transporter ATP-binding protein [Nitrospirota bacterium]